MNVLELIDIAVLNVEIIETFSLIILVIITGFYVYYTHKILLEQAKNNNDSKIIYKLENVYSPIEELLRNYLTDSTNEESLKQYNILIELLSNFYKIKSKYFHVIISDEVLFGYINDIFSEREKVFDNINSNKVLNETEVKNWFKHLNPDKELDETELLKVLSNISNTRVLTYKFILYTQYKIEEFNNEMCGIKSTSTWKGNAEFNTELKFNDFEKPTKLTRTKNSLISFSGRK